MTAAKDMIGSKRRRRGSPSTMGFFITPLVVLLVLAISPSALGKSQPSAASAVASAAETTEVVAIRAKVNNKYVTAPNAGRSSLIANRSSVDEWEKFDLIRISSTDVYLRAHNGKYVCAESAGAAALISNRDVADTWETFQLIKNSDGTSSLRARANNMYVTAEDAGASPLIANRTKIGLWEEFEFVKVTPGEQAPTAGPTSTPTAGPTSTPTAGPASTPTAGPASTPTAGPTSSPTPAGWPGLTNTGVPSGTNLSTYTGPLTITAANTIIDAKTINGTLDIRASGVEVRRSKINGSVLVNENSSYSATITDSTIDVGNREGTGLGDGRFTAFRVQITGGNRSVNCSVSCRIEDSYVYGQFKDNSGTTHESGIRMGANGVIRHNTIWCSAPEVPPEAGCSANLTGYGDFATVHDMTIDNNLFKASASSGFCAYGGSSPGKPYANAYNIVFTNNVFERGSNGKCGVYGPIIAFDSNASGNRWSGNVWDNGGTVPASN